MSGTPAGMAQKSETDTSGVSVLLYSTSLNASFDCLITEGSQGGQTSYIAI